jgi:anti-sigma B factor antagonist
MEPTRSAYGTPRGPGPQSWQSQLWRAEHQLLRRPRVGGLKAFLIGAAHLAPQVTVGEVSCAIGLAAIRSPHPMQADSDEYAAELSILQNTVGEGPSLDAFATARSQHAPQFRTEQRWPVFAQAARQHDVGSLVAQPLTLRSGATLGTLTLYSRRPAAFASEDLERIAGYAVLVATATSTYRPLARHSLTTTVPDPGSSPWAHGESPAELEITCTDHEDSVVVSVSGDLDLATSSWLRQQLLRRLGNRPAALIVVLEQVSFMDATGLRALAEAERCAGLLGTRFQIAGPRRLVRKMLAITGMDQELAIYPTLADALADGPDGTPTLSSANDIRGCASGRYRPSAFRWTGGSSHHRML